MDDPRMVLNLDLSEPEYRVSAFPVRREAPNASA
jgi:hypothetical protein